MLADAIDATDAYGLDDRNQDAASIFGDIGRAIGGAAKTVGHAVGGAAKAVGHAVGSAATWVHDHDPLGHVAMEIARGKRIDRAFGSGINLAGQTVKEGAPYVQTVLSVVPGLGQGAAMAIGAGVALASGQPISDVMIAAAMSAVPGGPLAKQAMEAGLRMTTALAQGKRLDQAALETVRAQLPGGPAAKAAFDAGTALATGRSIQEAAARALGSIPAGGLGQHALSVGADLLRGQRLDHALIHEGMRAVQQIAPPRGLVVPVPRIPMNVPNIGGALSQIAQQTASHLPSSPLGFARLVGADRAMTLPDPVSMAQRALPKVSMLNRDAEVVARALMHNPRLRGVSLQQLSSRLGVPFHEARNGMAALLHTLSLTAKGQAPHALTHAPHIVGLLDASDSLDQASTRLVSRAALPRQGSRALLAANGGRLFVARPLSRPHLARLLALAPAASRLPTSWLAALAAPAFAVQAHGVRDAGAVGPTDVSPTKWIQIQLAGFGRDMPSVINPSNYGRTGWKDIDGIMGPRTKTALLSFQKWRGLPATGVVDQATHDALRDSVSDDSVQAAMRDNGMTSSPSSPSKPAGDDHLRQAQVMVAAWFKRNGMADPPDYAASPSEFDGLMGPRTRRAFSLFQRTMNLRAKLGLRTDGTLDQATYDALTRETIPRAGGDTPSVPSSPSLPPAPRPPSSPGSSSSPTTPSSPSSPLSNLPALPAPPSGPGVDVVPANFNPSGGSAPAAPKKSDSGGIAIAALGLGALLLMSK